MSHPLLAAIFLRITLFGRFPHQILGMAGFFWGRTVLDVGMFFLLGCPGEHPFWSRKEGVRKAFTLPKSVIRKISCINSPRNGQQNGHSVSCFCAQKSTGCYHQPMLSPTFYYLRSRNSFHADFHGVLPGNSAAVLIQGLHTFRIDNDLIVLHVLRLRECRLHLLKERFRALSRLQWFCIVIISAVPNDCIICRRYNAQPSGRLS